MDIYVWGTHDCAERKKDFVDDFIKKRERGREERKSFPHTWETRRAKIRQRQKGKTRGTRWTTLSDWSFGLGQKTIQWRFYVRINRSSNPNWSQVRTILHPWNTKEKISRFNQILSFFFFFSLNYFYSSRIWRMSRNFQRRRKTKRWTMEIVIKEEVKVS